MERWDRRGVRLVHRTDTVLQRWSGSQHDPGRWRRPHQHGPPEVPQTAGRSVCLLTRQLSLLSVLLPVSSLSRVEEENFKVSIIAVHCVSRCFIAGMLLKLSRFIARSFLFFPISTSTPAVTRFLWLWSQKSQESKLRSDLRCITKSKWINFWYYCRVLHN